MPLREEIRELLSEIHRNGVSAESVEAAKLRMILDAEIERSSVPGLAMAWSRAVAVAGRSSPQEGVDAIVGVAVEDVARLARERLDPERAVVGIFTSGAKARSGSTPAEAAALPVVPEPAAPVTLPDWAARALRVHPQPRSGAPVTLSQTACG